MYVAIASQSASGSAAVLVTTSAIDEPDEQALPSRYHRYRLQLRTQDRRDRCRGGNRRRLCHPHQPAEGGLRRSPVGRSGPRSGSAKSAEDRGILTGVAQVSKGKWEVLQAQVTYMVKPDGDPHRHLDLPLQAPAAKAEGGAVGGTGDRAEAGQGRRGRTARPRRGAGTDTTGQGPALRWTIHRSRRSSPSSADRAGSATRPI